MRRFGSSCAPNRSRAEPAWSRASIAASELSQAALLVYSAVTAALRGHCRHRARLRNAQVHSRQRGCCLVRRFHCTRDRAAAGSPLASPSTHTKVAARHRYGAAALGSRHVMDGAPIPMGAAVAPGKAGRAGALYRTWDSCVIAHAGRPAPHARTNSSALLGRCARRLRLCGFGSADQERSWPAALVVTRLR